MPTVVCPTCLRHCRVRQQSLGRSVVCTHCAATFVAQPPAPAPEPPSYGPGGSRAWQGAAGMVLLLAFAALAVWLLLRTR